MANLADAIKAYRRAQATVARAEEAAAARIAAVKRAKEQARLALAAAIVEAARAGTRQVDIMKATGYSRERVRTILRAGGIEADD